MGRAVMLRCGSLAMVALLLSGCWLPLLAGVDVDVPAAMQTVMDDLDNFTPASSDPLAAVDPGTAVDDLATLDGCWGTVLSDCDCDFKPRLVVAYQFDAADGTFTRWSGAARADGVLYPLMPIISIEEGTFEVTGDASILLTVERILTNIDQATGRITETPQETPVPSDAIERPALVTLDGDGMLLYIDTETAADVDPNEPAPIFRQFDCPDAD